ncbi:hypothetical protein QAD02_017922 [Eretmocerus hayati]|uniref:Uncharacterized protein n=1 Tax=Eretmocerus hayati TaxID=131215 RepID=A0ACC2PFB2_9HYME|nr:hypothetical protein QAD02_017922 [Eretmocerus hayati]
MSREKNHHDHHQKQKQQQKVVPSIRDVLKSVLILLVCHCLSASAAVASDQNQNSGGPLVVADADFAGGGVVGNSANSASNQADKNLNSGVSSGASGNNNNNNNNQNSGSLMSVANIAEDCDPDMLGFELVTGYVYTAPKNLIETITGSLMLTECLETCQANDSCQAVNYETGLCVLFSSNADSNPGEYLNFIF